MSVEVAWAGRGPEPETDSRLAALLFSPDSNQAGHLQQSEGDDRPVREVHMNLLGTITPSQVGHAQELTPAQA